MIEKKLNDKIEDTVAVALKEELEQPPVLEPVVDPVSVTDTGEPIKEEINPEYLEASPPMPEPKIEVAGLGGIAELGAKLSKRVDEAERRVTPGLTGDLVQEQRGVIFVRGYTAEESEAITSALGGEYTKSLDFPAILDASGQFDAAAYMAKFKDANRELIENARRGTIPMERVIEYALSQDLEPVVKMWLSRTPGQTSNVEDFVTGVIGIDRVEKVVQELYKRADSVDITEEQRMQLLTQAHQYLSVMGQMLVNVSGAVSEGARVTASAGVLKRQGLPDLPQKTRDIVSLLESPQAHDVELTAQFYKGLDTRSARLTFTSKLMEGGAKTYQGMVTIWMNSLLSSLATHVINAAGNSSLQVLDLMETAVASAIGTARVSGKALYGKATGTEVNTTDRVYAGQSLAKLKGITYSLLDAFLVAGRTFKTGMPTDPVTKLDADRYRLVGNSSDFGVLLDQIKKGEVVPAGLNFINAVMTLPGRALMSSDEFFKATAYRGSVYEQAFSEGKLVYQQAISAGRSPEEAARIQSEAVASMIENPSMGIIESATDASKHLTLTEELKGLAGLIKTGVSYPFFKQVMPFATAPLNEFSQTLSRIPVVGGAVKRMRDDLAAGGARADKAIAKQVTASSIGLITMNLVSSNFGENDRVVITGAGPKDMNAKRAWQRMGFQPYSFNFPQENGTYTSRSYARMGPISGVLAVFSDYNYHSQYEQDYTKLAALGHAAVLSTADYMLTQPYLQTLDDLTNAMLGSDTESKINNILDKLIETQADFVLAGVPGSSSFGRSVVRTNLLGLEEEPDVTKYSTMIPYKDFLGNKVQDMPEFTHPFYASLQKMRASNWIFAEMREGLYPQLNIWNEVREHGTGATHEAYNPFRIREAKFTILDEEIVKLGAGIPNFPRKKDGVPLTDAQYNRWIELTNTIDSKKNIVGYSNYNEANTMKPRLLSLVTNPRYQAEQDRDIRLGKFKRVFNQYKKIAFDRLLEEDQELAERIEAAKKPTIMEPTPLVR